MKNKLPKQVLEELEANPIIPPTFVEAARKATIRDEGWDRIGGANTSKDIPEVIDTGLTVGDLLKS